jgi:hypothetical protein
MHRIGGLYFGKVTTEDCHTLALFRLTLRDDFSIEKYTKEIAVVKANREGLYFPGFVEKSDTVWAVVDYSTLWTTGEYILDRELGKPDDICGNGRVYEIYTWAYKEQITFQSLAANLKTTLRSEIRKRKQELEAINKSLGELNEL